MDEKRSDEIISTAAIRIMESFRASFEELAK